MSSDDLEADQETFLVLDDLRLAGSDLRVPRRPISVVGNKQPERIRYCRLDDVCFTERTVTLTTRITYMYNIGFSVHWKSNNSSEHYFNTRTVTMTTDKILKVLYIYNIDSSVHWDRN